MAKRFIVWALSGLALLLSGAATAQEVTPNPQPMSLKFSPQHLIFGGLHLDIEKTLITDSLQSLLLSPRFYSGQTRALDQFTGRSREEEDGSKVMGYGLEVLHRIYLSELSHEGSYFAYGLNYHHFNVEFEKKGWTQQIDAQGLET
ncbi:hypothetical protein ACXYMU_12515 [Pontibacter sp. CAU 1760]